MSLRLYRIWLGGAHDEDESLLPLGALCRQDERSETSSDRRGFPSNGPVSRYCKSRPSSYKATKEHQTGSVGVCKVTEPGVIGPGCTGLDEGQVQRTRVTKTLVGVRFDV